MLIVKLHVGWQWNYESEIVCSAAKMYDTILHCQSLSVDLVFSLLTFFSLHLLSVSCIFSCFQSLETNFILNRIEVTNFISVLGI